MTVPVGFETVAPGAGEGPVTVSVSRRVRPGREADYERWVSGVSRAAAAFLGHMAVNVLRPSRATDHSYVIIYRFDTWEHCEAWERSDERRRWTARLDDLVEGETAVKRVTGLEFWFDLPEVPASAHPSPHRMMVTLVVVVFSLLVLINGLLAPWLDGLHWVVRLLVVVVIQVPVMTYAVMPRVTRLLKPWLFGATQ